MHTGQFNRFAWVSNTYCRNIHVCELFLTHCLKEGFEVIEDRPHAAAALGGYIQFPSVWIL